MKKYLITVFYRLKTKRISTSVLAIIKGHGVGVDCV